MTNQLEITVEIIIHGTEDGKKIFDPIFEVFGIKEEEFFRERILGHYGNTILLAKAKLTKKRAEDFVRNLVSRISIHQMEELLENIEMHVEDSSLFLRISKNDLVRKIIGLQQNNAIKIKIKIPVYKKNELTKVYKELLKI